MMMAGGAKKHVPEGLPEVDSKSYGKFAVTNEVAAYRVSYATRNKMRVPAIVYHPAGETIMRRRADRGEPAGRRQEFLAGGLGRHSVCARRRSGADLRSAGASMNATGSGGLG